MDTSRPTILIVEDDEAYRLILTECLQSDYSLVIATTGEAALALLPQQSIDLILLDISLPGLDGYAVCRAIKSNPATQDIPVVFVTGLDQHTDEQYGLELGAADYITKPLSLALVKIRVQHLLELKQQRDRLQDLVTQRTNELALTQDAAIYGLGILAEFRDNETGSHIRRTQAYVELLARKLWDHPRFRGYFSESSLHFLIASAPLHDIGKVAIPDRILRKPGPLTDKERSVIKQHTLLGRQVVERIEWTIHDRSASSFLQFAKEVTYTHHEHWDGTGYHRLQAEAIPVSGRLMALADIYDALTTARVYKPAYSHAQACQILLQGDGRTRPEHFDPDVLQAFADLAGQFEKNLQLWQE